MCRRHERMGIMYLIIVAALTTNSSWLYMLMVAMDANFRLRSRLQGSSKNEELTLGLGWAYFVDNGSYSDFIKSYVDQDEVHILQRVYSLRETMTRHFADSDLHRFPSPPQYANKKIKGSLRHWYGCGKLCPSSTFSAVGYGGFAEGRTASNSTLCLLLIMLTSRTQAM